MGRSTGIMPIAIQAMAPATRAVMEVETSAQRPSVVASAALAPPQPRLMRVVKRARCDVWRGLNAGSVLPIARGPRSPDLAPDNFQYFLPVPIPVPGPSHITVTTGFRSMREIPYKELFRLHFRQFPGSLAFLATALAILAPLPALAWGPQGHEVMSVPLMKRILRTKSRKVTPLGMLMVAHSMERLRV